MKMFLNLLGRVGLLVVFIAASMTPAVSWASQGAPNVLLVVADDLGFTDLGSFGGEIDTPNLDSLAESGMRFREFYTAPTCSPTRAMLMTGVDNHLVGLGNMAEALTPNQRGKQGYEGFLNRRAAFLPQSFADSGYRTLMAGKWHLGKEEENSPSARGFEQTFALLNGGAGHFSDLGINSHPSQYRKNGKLVDLPEDFYSTRFYTDTMIDFIESGRDSGKPFFAYLAYTAPHWPLQAPDESIRKYKDKYAAGYDVLQQQRIAKAKEIGVVSSEAVGSSRFKGEKPWAELSAEQQKVSQRTMEIYAAMVDDLDSNFGRLINYLKDSGQFDNTIIFFMSDNGAEGGAVGQGIFRQPIFAEYIESCCNNAYENLGKPDSYVLYGPSWARASVGAFKEFKGRTTEGGIKSPAFIVAPGMSSPGSISTQFVTVKDVLPTLMDLAGVALPKKAEIPVEGRSIYSSKASVAEMGWEFMNGKAYRFGEWKLYMPSSRGAPAEWQLYNLEKDPSELNNLAKQEPDKLDEMIALWTSYEQSKAIIPPILK